MLPLPDVLGTAFADVVANLNAECHAGEVAERRKCGMFATGTVYDWFPTVAHANAQCHLLSSETSITDRNQRFFNVIIQFRLS